MGVVILMINCCTPKDEGVLNSVGNGRQRLWENQGWHSINAAMNSAATCGMIALPAPRSLPTSPGNSRVVIDRCELPPSFVFVVRPPSESLAFGVGHPEKALPDVWRADARSAQIGGPDGISQVFQVSTNSGEPFAAKRARNLLSKDRCRAALGDEAVKSGPEVAFVGMALALSRARKRLTGTGACPDWTVVVPSGKAERQGPSANSGEEMALSVFLDIVDLDISDAPLLTSSPA